MKNRRALLPIFPGSWSAPFSRPEIEDAVEGPMPRGPVSDPFLAF